MGVSETLLRAYRAAEYVVFGDPQVVVRIGAPAPQLGRAAFVTACNPEGKPQDDDTNRAAQAQLEARLEKGGWRYVRGEGRDPAGGWKAEPSFLVLGIPKDEAEALGRRFRQNAIVYLEPGRPAELVVLR